VVTEPAAVAKSNIILDVKPWDDETDMAKLEECVRSIEMDGLLWGACKLQMTGVDMCCLSNNFQLLIVPNSFIFGLSGK